ncbi:unnamed protein product, partial [Effrenium voratum]
PLGSASWRRSWRAPGPRRRRFESSTARRWPTWPRTWPARAKAWRAPSGSCETAPRPSAG